MGSWILIGSASRTVVSFPYRMQIGEIDCIIAWTASKSPPLAKAAFLHQNQCEGCLYILLHNTTINLTVIDLESSIHIY